MFKQWTTLFLGQSSTRELGANSAMLYLYWQSEAQLRWIAVSPHQWDNQAALLDTVRSELRSWKKLGASLKDVSWGFLSCDVPVERQQFVFDFFSQMGLQPYKSKSFPAPGLNVRLDLTQNPLRVQIQKVQVECKISVEPVRVLIVDDSPTVRKLLRAIFEKAEGGRVLVVADVENTAEAEKILKNEKIDVMTLDQYMPEETGLQFLQRMQKSLWKVPTLLVTDCSKEEGTIVLDALGFGAFDYVQKPGRDNLAEVSQFLLERVQEAAKTTSESVQKSTQSIARAVANPLQFPPELILVGSSTGGTEVIKHFCSALTGEIPPVVIVQHMPAQFTGAFAQSIQYVSNIPTLECQGHERLEPGKIYVAPGGKHLLLDGKGQHLQTLLSDSPPVNRFRPSVDVLFQSVPTSLASRTLAIIFTGMGDDGARGLLQLKNQGAMTWTQSEETCLVYGMPRVAVEMGASQAALAPETMASFIVNAMLTKTRPNAS